MPGKFIRSKTGPYRSPGLGWFPCWCFLAPNPTPGPNKNIQKPEVGTSRHDHGNGVRQLPGGAEIDSHSWGWLGVFFEVGEDGENARNGNFPSREGLASFQKLVCVQDMVFHWTMTWMAHQKHTQRHTQTIYMMNVLYSFRKTCHIFRWTCSIAASLATFWTNILPNTMSGVLLENQVLPSGNGPKQSPNDLQTGRPNGPTICGPHTQLCIYLWKTCNVKVIPKCLLMLLNLTQTSWVSTRVFATTRGRTGPVPLCVGHPGMCEESIWYRALSGGCLRRLEVRTLQKWCPVYSIQREMKYAVIILEKGIVKCVIAVAFSQL